MAAVASYRGGGALNLANKKLKEEMRMTVIIMTVFLLLMMRQ
jgi:hypothetical protein